ncbi:Immunoglobulin-like domain,Immunoglobulin-like fold, partial [Cinara cedri]
MLCIFCELLTARLNSVIILEQKVPAAVLNGSEYVVLDCLYRLNPNKTEGLSVTWYFNNSPSLTYQWIPGFEVQTMGPLKSHILAGYKVNTDDELAKYRAVYIIRPTIELTGNYKCVVSTFYDEDFMIKKMTVYAPGQNLRMRRMKTVHRGQVNISCTISKVFPIPQIQMYIVVESNGTTN